MSISSCQTETTESPEIAWEKAYLRFETPRAEIKKFKRRYAKMGFATWDPKERIVEIFCGRGNGLVALAELGFKNTIGVDLSYRLLAERTEESRSNTSPLIQSDCRQLPFADNSIDKLVVQGGLHHLPVIPDDLALVIAECHRVLRRGGKLLIVEPWDTLFLRLAHLAMKSRLCCNLYPKLEALAEMTKYEYQTYFSWLSKDKQVLAAIDKHLSREMLSIGWGKLIAVYTRHE